MTEPVEGTRQVKVLAGRVAVRSGEGRLGGEGQELPLYCVGTAVLSDSLVELPGRGLENGGL